MAKKKIKKPETDDSLIVFDTTHELDAISELSNSQDKTDKKNKTSKLKNSKLKANKTEVNTDTSTDTKSTDTGETLANVTMPVTAKKNKKKRKKIAVADKSKHLSTKKFTQPLQQAKKSYAFHILTFFVVFLLVLSAIAVTEQVHQYRMSFNESQQLRKNAKKLDIQWHKLLLEQQTFGATTRIGSRAVVMGMYSPKIHDVMTMTLKPAKKTDRSTIDSDE